ncbi:unnamed protein product [Triticum aestivum]|uniref:Uncharacterized protein n=1 Tax=Triticum aestivum TaxID=4565 RepID=A0A7H4LB26_WHEAT|nr:unnamed protein product [Triticum aestivum]
MAKRNTVVLLLALAIVLSYSVLEGVAQKSQVAFSRKVMNTEQKASFSRMIPSLGGQVSGATDAGGASNNAEISNAKTTAATESHRDVSWDQFRGIIIHTHQVKKP